MPGKKRKTNKEEGDASPLPKVQGRLPVGTKMKKYFEGYGWFDGFIDDSNDHYCHVTYSDGDHETMHHETALQYVVAPSVVVISDDSSLNTADQVPSIQCSIKTEENDPVAVVTPTKKRDDKSDPLPDVPMSIKTEQESGPPHPLPDAAPSSLNRQVAEILSDSALDCRIKQEGSAVTLTPEEREKRRACLEKWIKANTDPRTGLGRYVFRRACHESCITTILGGYGMDPWPISRKPPTNKHTGTPNRFITSGEFYVAGNEGFNPFGPRFPGDKGLVNAAAFGEDDYDSPRQDQREFHLFVQCSKYQHLRHYHGKSAAAGRMYVGVYRRCQGDDDVMSTTVYFKEMELDHQKCIADFYYRYRTKYPEYAPLPQDYGQQQDDIAATRTRLIKVNWTMDACPVEFVRYDEGLYQALVDTNAMTNRQGERGRVSLEPERLYYYC